MNWLTMILLMIVIQVFIMPFVSPAEIPAHSYFSVNQAWMGAIMGAAMAAIGGLLPAHQALVLWEWAAIFAIGAVAVAGYRGQWLVSDREFLRDMIPHHSMALLTSRVRVDRTTDVRVRRLAEQIIVAQEREIHDMRRLLADPGL